MQHLFCWRSCTDVPCGESVSVFTNTSTCINNQSQLREAAWVLPVTFCIINREWRCQVKHAIHRFGGGGGIIFVHLSPKSDRMRNSEWVLASGYMTFQTIDSVVELLWAVSTWTLFPSRKARSCCIKGNGILGALLVNWIKNQCVLIWFSGESVGWVQGSVLMETPSAVTVEMGACHQWLWAIL